MSLILAKMRTPSEQKLAKKKKENSLIEQRNRIYTRVPSIRVCPFIQGCPSISQFRRRVPVYSEMPVYLRVSVKSRKYGIYKCNTER